MSKDPLRSRSIVLVGLMGAGKSSVGKRLAGALGLNFRDTDDEIEKAAGQTVSEIFSAYGETYFRDGERRVIARLLDEPTIVLATGGGAFMNEQTRALIKAKAVSVWLKADVEVLARRVSRKDTRPLLAGKDPREVLQKLADERYPVYAEADIVIESGDIPHNLTVETIIRRLWARAAHS
ncbi:shikimate kinase [soil metagenome]